MRPVHALVFFLCLLGFPGETSGEGGFDLVIDEPEDGAVVRPPFVVRGRVLGTPPPRPDGAAPAQVHVCGSPRNIHGGRFRAELHPEEDGRFEIDARWIQYSLEHGMQAFAEDAIAVVVDSKAPELEILVPARPTTLVPPGTGKIVGRVADLHLAALTIDKMRVPLGPGGCFSVPVPVPEGDRRTVRLVAWDVVGNRIDVERTLVGDPGAPTWRRVDSPVVPRKGAPSLYTGGREQALGPARAVETALIDAAAGVREHTVSLVTADRPGGARARTGSAGSGVVLELDGKPWILTADHVIEDAVRVAASGLARRLTPVRIQDRLRRFDVALLALDASAPLPGRPLRTPKVARLPEVGTWVIATGNPRDLCSDGVPAVMRGLVSSTRREIKSAQGVSMAIQHDARIHPGCSGGGLWDLRRNLLGISVRIRTLEDFAGARGTNVGITYSIPLTQIRPFLDAMRSESTARSATLGIETATELDDRGQALGARIVSIERSGPLGGTDARRAPRPGDVILELTVEGEKRRVYTSQDLDRELARLEPGTQVTLHYRRGHARLTWTTQVTRGAR